MSHKKQKRNKKLTKKALKNTKGGLLTDKPTDTDIKVPPIFL